MTGGEVVLALAGLGVGIFCGVSFLRIAVIIAPFVEAMNHAKEELDELIYSDKLGACDVCKYMHDEHKILPEGCQQRWKAPNR